MDIAAIGVCTLRFLQNEQAAAALLRTGFPIEDEGIEAMMMALRKH